MKKIFLTAALLITCFTSKLYAQPQWKFHIAFEDASGAKDTIWLIWDTAATYGLDTIFSEGKVNLNYNVFNVFIGNTNGDTTKTQALPHPYSSNDVIVYAMNYQYPLIISWDSALFNAPNLPMPVGYVNYARINNDYFFFQNNLPIEHQFDMLQNNQTLAPSFNWFSQSQFPMGFYLHRDPALSLVENIKEQRIRLYPSPVKDFLNLKAEMPFNHVAIFNCYSALIYETNCNTNSLEIETSNLPEGIYFIKISNNLNLMYYEKFIKTH